MVKKEVFKEPLLGLALLLSFMLIISIVAAVLPPPPPIPESPEEDTTAPPTPGTPGAGDSGAPPTPGTPGAGDSGAPPTPGTPGAGDGGVPPTPGTPGAGVGGAPSTPGTPPSGDGTVPSSSDGAASSGGDGGDYTRRRAGEGYTYGDAEAPSAGEITTSMREAPPVMDGGYEGDEEQLPAGEEQPPTDEKDERSIIPSAAKNGYIRIGIIIFLVLLAIAAIVWAIMRWKAHKEQEGMATKEIEAAEKELYLQKEKPSKKPAAKKGPLPPGMR